MGKKTGGGPCVFYAVAKAIKKNEDFFLAVPSQVCGAFSCRKVVASSDCGCKSTSLAHRQHLHIRYRVKTHPSISQRNVTPPFFHLFQSWPEGKQGKGAYDAYGLYAIIDGAPAQSDLAPRRRLFLAPHSLFCGAAVLGMPRHALSVPRCSAAGTSRMWHLGPQAGGSGESNSTSPLKWGSPG